MADLKHCAQMADSKCHHSVEFLFPEYANDRYTIQRDARSIGFFFLGKMTVFLIDYSKLEKSRVIRITTRRIIIYVILLNFRSSLGHMDKLEVT